MLKGTWRRKGKSHLQNLEREGEGSKEARGGEKQKKERKCIAKKREEMYCKEKRNRKRVRILGGSPKEEWPGRGI